MKTRSKNPSKGFTLIELLVAMAITTIIISILVSVTSLSLDAWNRSRSEVRAARQGKTMIDSMARDFESLVIKTGKNVEWLYAETYDQSRSSEDAGYPMISSTKASPNALDMIFFTAATDRYDGKVGTSSDLGGDVSTVSYELAYRDPIGTSSTDDFKTFVLYRKLLDPDKTFGVGASPGTLGEPVLKTAFEAAIGSGNSIQNANNFICENVYEFTVTFHIRIMDSTSERMVRIPVAPVSENTVSKFSITGVGNIVDSIVNEITPEEIKSGQLTAAEISLTVLTDFGLKQLRARTFSDTADQTADEVKAEFIAENSYQYSKLVQVPGS